MHLSIHPSAREASLHVANLIISHLKSFTPTAQKPNFILGLPTGSSPEQIYAFLVEAHRKGEISFKEVITFNMDEYVGLPTSHPQSYHTFMYNHLFAYIDIDPKNVHILNGMASDLEAECLAYEQLISHHGPIDLFLGGVGPSGHIAFNEPFSSLNSRTRPVVLASSTISANARFFENDINLVPKQALTVGVGTIMDAREVIIIATGGAKAEAIRRGIEGPVTASWTVSKLQEHGNVRIVVDGEAAGRLRGETVEYFQRVREVEANVAGKAKL